jgi:hypothetical protein
MQIKHTLLALLLCAAIPAMGGVLVKTGFEGYPSSGAVAGTTAPATGDVGIQSDSTWGGGNWSWQASGLSYTDANGTIDGGSRALDYTGSNYQFRQANVPFSTAIQETVFIRFLAKLDAVPTGTNVSGVQLVINNDLSNNNNNFMPGFGIHAGGSGRTDGREANHFFASDSSAALSGTTLPTSLFGGTATANVYMLVGRMNWDGAKFSSLDVWVNPANDDLSSIGTTIDISGNNITSITHLVVRGGSTTGGPRSVADEIVIATSWDDVTVVPEPTTVALFLGLGSLGLVMWRRRRA